MKNNALNIPGRRSSLIIMVGLLSLLIAGYLAVPNSALAGGGKNFVQKESKNNFATTVQKLKKEVSAQKLALLKDYNTQMMLKMVGVKSSKGMTFAIFHPRYGKVLNENDPNAFSAVPLRIIIQERGGKVIVGYMKPSAIFADYDIPNKTKKELDGLFEKILNKATN